MGKVKEISQLVLFTVIIGIIFGTGYFPTESLAQELKSSDGDKDEKGNKFGFGNNRPRGPDPVEVPGSTICMGKTLDQWAAEGKNVIKGTDQRDRMSGTSGDDVMAGGDGNDRISSGNGDDIVCGGNGNDRIATGNGEDFADGGAGRDIMITGNDDDVIFAQDGEEDTLNAGRPSNSDTCFVDGMPGDIEERKVKGCENLFFPYAGIG